MARLPGFIGPSAVSLSPQQDCERTVNYYIEPAGSKYAKNALALYPSPGFSSYLSVAKAGSRALFEMNGACWGVIGDAAYQFFNTHTATALGTVVNDGNRAQVESNGAVGAQILFASGTNAYCFVPATSAFTQVLTGDATMIGMLDGYFIALNPTTSKIRLSNLNDGTTWSPTQFAQRSDAPDNWAAMVVAAPDIWLIGQQTGCVYFDAGTFPFPLAPRPGATFKYGTIAPWSLATAGGNVIWLSHNKEGNGIVVMAIGYAPQKISSAEVDTAIAAYDRTVGISDAEAMMFQFQGHTFYALSFPRAKVTWVYDLQSGLWVEWGKWINALTAYDIWAPRVHCHAFGVHLTGDRNTGTLAIMDSQYGSELDGTAIRRMRITPALFSENRQFLMRRLELFVEAGLGLVSGQGSDPIVTVQVSDDGGQTYFAERQGKTGKIGQYPKRCFWTRLGLPRNRVFKFVMSDPIPWRVLDCFFNNDASNGGGGSQ